MFIRDAFKMMLRNKPVVYNGQRYIITAVKANGKVDLKGPGWIDEVLSLDVTLVNFVES